MHALVTLLAILIASHNVFAQFFVLYGKDSVAQRADPIVNPGRVAQHVHDFTGSGSVGPGSTFAKLRQGKCSSLGAANGSSINQDRSAYWSPSLYVKNLQGQYVKVPVIMRQIYYKNVGQGAARQPFEFPAGFRMLAGNKQARAPLPDSPTNLDDVSQWICHGPVWNIGAQGAMPKNVTSCPNYPYFNAAIHFPHCWNGKAYRASAPYAHMSYPVGDIQGGVCPGSHPIRLPHIFIETDFYLENMLGQFQPDTFVLSNGDPTGYGYHADFLNGWTPGTLPQLLTGSSACNSHDVGDCSGVTFDSSYPWNSCQARLAYTENINGPFSALPGCNPITTQNPAPDMPSCSLGVIGGNPAVNAINKAAKPKTTTVKAASTASSARQQNANNGPATVTITQTLSIVSYKTRTVTATPTPGAKTTKKRSVPVAFANVSRRWLRRGV